MNDEQLKFNIRPDYIVERHGMKYIAEIKTGAAACPKDISTRRQLLEYAIVSKSNTIILVDANSETIMHVCFND